MKLPKLANLIVALPTISITLMWLGSGCGKDRQESPTGNMEKRSADTLPETIVTQTNKSQHLRPTVNADTPPNPNHVGNLKAPPMTVLKPTFGVIGTHFFILLMLICSGCSPNGSVRSAYANDASGSNNLRQIYWILVRASGNAPNFPFSFSNLNASVNSNLFVCPQSGRQPGPMYEVEEWTDYIYVGNQTDGALSDVAMVLSPPENHGGKKGYVLFVDGSISVLPSDQIKRLIRDPFCMATNGTPNNTPGNIENEKQRVGIRLPKRFSSYLAVP